RRNQQRKTKPPPERRRRAVEIKLQNRSRTRRRAARQQRLAKQQVVPKPIHRRSLYANPGPMSTLPANRTEVCGFLGAPGAPILRGMPSRRRFAPALGPLAVAVLLVPPGAHAAESVAARSSPQRPPYVQREPSFDGTGRFYMGREIARVMGHQGAAWLERPERVDEEQPEVLLSLLDLRPGMVVADIGAGTGYHSWRIARKVLPGGRVLAVDI